MTDGTDVHQRIRRTVAGVYSGAASRYDRVVTNGLVRIGVPGGSRAVAEWASHVARDATPVLDVPAGTGEYLAHLPQPAVGVDLAAGMLRRAAVREPDAPLVRADAFVLPFPDGSVGTVFTALGLQLFPRPRDAVAEMTRVLRRGGTVTGVVPMLPVTALPFGRLSLRRALDVPGLEVERIERRRFLVFFVARKTT